MKQDISKETKIAASNGMLGFEIMVTPLTNINTPKKITSPVAKAIKKLTEKGSSDLKTVYHKTVQETMFTVTSQPIKWDLQPCNSESATP